MMTEGILLGVAIGTGIGAYIMAIVSVIRANDIDKRVRALEALHD